MSRCEGEKIDPVAVDGNLKARATTCSMSLSSTDFGALVVIPTLNSCFRKLTSAVKSWCFRYFNCVSS